MRDNPSVPEADAQFDRESEATEPSSQTVGEEPTPDVAQTEWLGSQPSAGSDLGELFRESPPGASDRFDIQEQLGAGGMGQVFKAFDRRLKRHVALKFLLAENPDTVRRFMHEAQAQARVQHDNVCRIYEVGEVRGKPCIAMRYIEGRSLAAAAGELSLEQKLAILAAVADGLQAAHRTGLIHRDLNPANIMLERRPDGELHPYILDFGIAVETGGDPQTIEGLAGTPAFMAPEQLEGDLSRLDRRTDIYGLGATLYQLCTGRAPFLGTTPMVVAAQIVSSDPQPLRAIDTKIPVDVQTIVAKCLEKEPSRRYDSAAAFAADLRCYLDGRPISARPASLPYRLGKAIRRHRLLSAVILAATVLVAVAAVAWLRERMTAQEQAAAAHRLGQEVKEIEAIMRFAQMSPLHEIGLERQLVRDRMARISSHLATMGRAERGPALHALGRGALALDDPEAALLHLQASRNAGYQSAEVAYGLGLALAGLYQRALIDAQQMADAEARDAWLAGKRAQLRDPAIANFRQGRETAEVAETLSEAQLAFLEERWQDAVDAADRALERKPWLWEALVLQGRVRHTQGDLSARQGAYREAREHYDRALESYRSAIDHARSGIDGYLGYCNVWSSILLINEETGDDYEEPYRDAVQVCSKALLVDPDDIGALLALAGVNLRYGIHRQRAGADPTAAFEEALQLAGRARDLAPQRAEVQDCLGHAHLFLAHYAMHIGDDPGEQLAQAISALEEAVARAPGRTESWFRLGNCHLYRGRVTQRGGGDPRAELQLALDCFGRAAEARPPPSTAYRNMAAVLAQLGEYTEGTGEDPTALYRQAAEAAERASALNPGSASALVNLAYVLAALGEYQLNHGIDPTPVLTRTVAVSDQAASLNSQMAFVHINKGKALLSLAQYRMQRGGDPSDLLQAAEAGYQAAIELNANDALTYLHVGALHSHEADFLVSRGRNPLAAVQQSRAALERSIELNPSWQWPYQTQTVVCTTVARWELLRGRDPSRWLRLAESAGQQARRINPNDSVLLCNLAQLRLLAAEWAVEQVESPERSLAAAVELAKQSLAIDANNARPHLLLGEAEGLRARWQRGRSGSPEEAAAAAQLHLDRAAQIDPYDPDIPLATARTLHEVARWCRQQGADTSEIVTRSRQALDRVLELNPSEAEAHALLAAVALIESQASDDAARTGELRTEASRSLQASLAGNPLLKKRYDWLVDQLGR